MHKVLEGVRVLDFGRYIAGPYCATLLGDLGAEVIRVERTVGSEDRYLMPVTDSGDGALHLQMGRNKLGMTLDPMKPAGREILRRLAATADIVVANLPPSGLAAMGLDYESLRAVRADIILTTITAFGTGGPDSDRVGFDGVAQASCGGMYLSGPPGQPTRSTVSFMDFGTASLAAFATVAALMARRQSGKGQHVEASLLATGLSFAGPYLVEQGTTGVGRTSTGNRGQTAGPADCFQTRDGWLVVQCVGQPLFRRWCRLMGEEHWLEDARFATDQGRGDHGAVLSGRMARWCAQRDTQQALAELAAARIPAGPVLSPQQALDDPHIRGTGFLCELDYPGLSRPAPVPDTPVRFSGLEAGARRRAPTLGEHTEELLGSLGYSPAEIADLRARAVI